MNEWIMLQSTFYSPEEISTIPPLLVRAYSFLLPMTAHYKSCVLATSIWSLSVVLPFSFIHSHCCHLFMDVLFPLPSFKARCLGGQFYEAFPSFRQCRGRICGSLMVLAQSLERIFIITFIPQSMFRWVFVNLSDLLYSELTKEWDILYSSS